MKRPTDKECNPKNLRVTLTINSQIFKALLTDLSEEAATIGFTSDKAATPGNAVEFEILTSKGEVVEGTGKLQSVSMSQTFVGHFALNIKYNQLSKKNLLKLGEEFLEVQKQIQEYLNKLNRVA